jgi:hypothetical protein
MSQGKRKGHVNLGDSTNYSFEIVDGELVVKPHGSKVIRELNRLAPCKRERLLASMKCAHLNKYPELQKQLKESK